MRKNIIAVLLAGMMLSVTACGSGSPEVEDTVAGVDAEKARETAEAEMKARHQERTESSKKAEEETEEEAEDTGGRSDERSAEEERREDGKEEEEQSGSEEESDDDYVKGEITDTTFESEWIGLRYELPEGFEMSSEEYMDAILQAGGEMLYEGQADLIMDYARLTMVYEMMASDIYNDSITIFVEKTRFDPDTYVEVVKNQVGNIDAIDITISDGDTVKVCGVEFEKYSLTLSYGGMTAKEDYYLKKKGDRMICMLITYSDDKMVETLMSGFSPY